MMKWRAEPSYQRYQQMSENLMNNQYLSILELATKTPNHQNLLINRDKRLYKENIKINKRKVRLINTKLSDSTNQWETVEKWTRLKFNKVHLYQRRTRINTICHLQLFKKFRTLCKRKLNIIKAQLCTEITRSKKLRQVETRLTSILGVHLNIYHTITLDHNCTKGALGMVTIILQSTRKLMTWI